MDVAASVAICSRHRPEQLRRALRSVLSQSREPAEVLVIDSNPAGEGYRPMLAREFPQVRYMREFAPGVGFARQRALREARHDILAFLDDDAVADVDWLHALVSAMTRAGGAAACTGRVMPLMLDTPAQRLFEANGGFDRGTRRIVLPHDRTRLPGGLTLPLIASAVSVGSGCSLALDRQAALEVGGFDGLFGGSSAIPGGEDLDLLWRLIEAGHFIVYEPAALAWHEHRRDLESLGAQLANHQRGLVAMLTKALLRAGFPLRAAIAVFLCWRLLKPGARLASRSLGRDPLPFGMLVRMWRSAVGAPLAYARARSLTSDAMKSSAIPAAALQVSSQKEPR